MKYLALTLAYFFSASILWAQSSSRAETQGHPFSASFNLSYNSLSNSIGTSLSGPGLEFQLLYGLNQNWGLALAIKQLSFGSGGSASAVSFRATYALIGRLNKETQKVYHNNKLMVESQSLESRCLCLQVLASQYFLNATQTTVPFTGFGFNLYYKMPTSYSFSLVPGVQYESVQNNSTLSILSLFVGTEFRF